MPFEKIPAILLIIFGFYMTYGAPTPPTPKGKRRTGSDPIGVNWLVWTPKAGCYAHAIIELSIILDGIWSKGFVARLLPDGKNPDCIKLTPTTIFATVLVVLGASLRYWCFHEMGRHFTLHITLLKNHKLITTGPYSIVRHPSYTGLVFMLIGKVIWYWARGSWLRESMGYQIKAAWVVFAPVMYVVLLVFVMIARRLAAEDVILKGEFGKEWDEWAEKVPYQLFPGIL